MDLEHGSIATTKSWVGIYLPCLPGSATPEISRKEPEATLSLETAIELIMIPGYKVCE